jgi:hypothetical protein
MDIYIPNKYSNIYFAIVNQSISENRSRKDNRIYEQHHIIPKSCGGSDEPDNLVLLTPKEHYICHRLLPKMVKSKLHYEKMIYALWSLVNGNGRSKRYSPSGRIYQQIREEQSKVRSERIKGKNPYQRQDVKEMIKKSNVKRYGVDNISKLKSVKEKKVLTCLNNYGVENPLQSKEIKEKIRNTNIEKYGVDHNMKREEVRKKAENTFLEKYGKDNPSKCDMVKAKISKKAMERSNREIVLLIKEHLIKNKMKLSKGWHHKSDADLIKIYQELTKE